MVRPTVELSLSGDGYTLKVLSALMNSDTSFVPAQEFNETLQDDWAFATTFIVEGSKLVQRQKNARQEITIERELAPDGVTAVCYTPGKAAVRKYKRVARTLEPKPLPRVRGGAAGARKNEGRRPLGERLTADPIFRDRAADVLLATRALVDCQVDDRPREYGAPAQGA